LSFQDNSPCPKGRGIVGRQAFTLVELIVVITILAILSTIGFLAMQSYNQYARDTIRTSDLSLISR
jgi:prepilin-type N-terminal cleavage/methylation domain-containing protein